ncbi:hypothetical protein [Nocardioides panacisoli]|uniref:DUF4386 domain-containing protein n=1 Tax=Nocardioides panacisoli TaxID=627624 RepID=A0ABP7IEK7_9ACTN
MSTTIDSPARATGGAIDATRLSTRFGVAYAVCQLLTLVGFSIFVLPHAGSPSDSALERGHRVDDASEIYRVANYLFVVSGALLVGFLGAVSTRLRRIDASGTLAAVALAAGTLLGVIWPLAGVLHDVALDAAADGADLRLLGAWDAVAPYSLAFSALPRLFFVGAIVLGLRAAGTSPWLVRTGCVLLVLSAIGSATLVAGALFPLLALGTLGYELWVGAVAWHWLRGGRGEG